MADRASSSAGSLVERLLVQCLEQPAALRGEVLDRLCAAHPDQAAKLRALHGRLARMGLDGLATAEGDFPERLGGFRLLRRLGGGGMGVVYLAEQESFGRKVALKLVQPTQLYFPGARARFRREAQAIAALKHPGIVPVFEYGEEQDIPYLAMEWVEGLTLAQVLERVRNRPPHSLTGADLGALLENGDAALFLGSWPTACLRIGVAVAEALAHAHAQGVVHRDIKPGNVMLTRDGRVYLLDFGLAHTRDAQTLTTPGGQPGSLPYMAPEQIAGEAADAASDVYALGILLFEALTLRLPYLEASADATRQAIRAGVHPSIRSLNRAVPRAAEIVCHKAMAAERAQRYGSMAALLADLRSVLEQRPILARPPGPLARVRRWAGRNPAVALLGSLLVLLLLASLTLSLWQYHSLALAHGALLQEAEQRRSAMERLQLMSDHALVDRLQQQSKTMPPVRPENEAGYERWLLRAREVAARLPAYRQALDHLPASADGLQDPEERERLAGLVLKLAELIDPEVGRMPLMAARLEYIRNLQRASVGDCTAAWAQAAQEIADDARFAGFMLLPQLGLVPLGPDPESHLQEFLHLPSHEGPVPRRDARGRLPVGVSTGIILVLIPGGRVWIGTQARDPALPNYNPHPRRDDGIAQVHFAPYLIGKYEVTDHQWWRCTRDPAFRHRSSQNLPACGISWFAGRDGLRAVDLCLPSENRWERACRAGSETIWCMGNTPSDLQHHANLFGAENAPDASGTLPWSDGFKGLAPVGSFRPNGFGLYDMYGNVLEWCTDAGSAHPTGKQRPTRGGWWQSDIILSTSAARIMMEPELTMGTLGLRAARELER